MNPISGANLTKFITKMTKADAMYPIAALEATVVAGRTLQAYKRGKGDEARERFIEETTGSIVWLGGVKSLNALGDKILGKLFNCQGVTFDVGTDKILRTPFKNFMNNVAPRGFSPKQVALIKAFKVLSSIILADVFIGLVVPPLNQSLTKTLSYKKKAEERKSNHHADSNNNNPTFKGGYNLINLFTNAIENNNTGKLLSTDAGLVSGRMYSARNKDERREIAIRDIGSIYFYMWAQGHVRNVMNFIETGRTSRLNPETTTTLHKKLIEVLNKNSGEMSADTFRTLLLGKNIADIKLPEGVKFETGELSYFERLINKIKPNKYEPLQVARVSQLESLKEIAENPSLIKRIQEMANIQPKRNGISVITKEQLIDAINTAEINNPSFLRKVYREFTEGKSEKEFEFISNSKLTALKQEMVDYIDDICKKAKDGKITEELLEKAKKDNIKFNGINFVSGFAVAALFLSTFIPKIQYWVTKKRTGLEYFPGTYEYNKDKNPV